MLGIIFFYVVSIIIYLKIDSAIIGNKTYFVISFFILSRKLSAAAEKT